MATRAVNGAGELSDRQRTFVREYVVDFNGTQAALRAGYATSGASVEASRLLANPKVQVAVRQAVERRVARTQVTADRVVLELARLAFFDPRKLFDETGALRPVTDLDDDTAAALSSIEVFEEFVGFGEGRIQVGVTKKLKLWDKNKALDVLAKHTGVYRDTILQIFNVIQSPQWAELRTVLLMALESHPKARADVIAALEEHAGPSGNGQPAAG